MLLMSLMRSTPGFWMPARAAENERVDLGVHL